MLIKKNITFSLEIKGKVTKKKRNDQIQLEILVSDKKKYQYLYRELETNN